MIDLYDSPNNHTESSLTKQLRQSKRKFKTFQIDKSDSLAIADYILNQIPAEKIIFVNAFANPVEWKDNIFLPEVEAELINRLIQKSSKVIVTSFGSPYLIQDFPDNKFFLFYPSVKNVLAQVFLTGLFAPLLCSKLFRLFKRFK